MFHLQFLTILTSPRGLVIPRGIDRLTWTPSGDLGFEMCYVAGASTIDGDPPRLHGLRDFPNQLDLQQSVIERPALHLDVVRQIELPPEGAGRYTPIEVLAFVLFGLGALDRDDVMLGGNRDSAGENPATASEIW
jgi:hypothetical protein